MERYGLVFGFHQEQRPGHKGLTGSLQNTYQPGRVFVGYMTNFRHGRSAVEKHIFVPLLMTDHFLNNQPMLVRTQVTLPCCTHC
jgi:hypothetical protein